MTDQQLAASPAFAGLTSEQVALRIAALNRPGDLYAKYDGDPGCPAWKAARYAFPRRRRVFGIRTLPQNCKGSVSGK